MISGEFLDVLNRLTRKQVREIAQRNFDKEPLIAIACAPGYDNPLELELSIPLRDYPF